MICKICGKENYIQEVIGLCVDCVRGGDSLEHTRDAHKRVREKFSLPSAPPDDPDGVYCGLCANECRMGVGRKGYCGLRWNECGKLVSLVNGENAIMHAYLDPLPTNCCAAWFCPCSGEHGRQNLAVFFYGCSFNCLFCQNCSHKNLSVPGTSIDGFLQRALNPEVSCICYFGGSPEPQLPFAIKASEKVLKKRKIRICWEWNGSGNPELVKKAARLSLESGGTVKFDLKAFNENLNFALCGVSNKRVYENFKMIAKGFYESSNPPLLTATTLLVPGYIDKEEVGEIARFIANLNEEIPYSLLVFHPDFYMKDLPVTPKKQAGECYGEARRYLKNVNIGNKHMLYF